MITQSKLKALFNYIDGELYWKVRPIFTSINISIPAGHIDSHHGYRIIMIDKRHYRAHRLIFMYHHNCKLPSVIDHINNNKIDNRIENLRSATSAQNSGNAKLSLKNKSGFKGVHFSKQLKKWRGGVCVKGRTTYTAPFEVIEDAVVAVQKLRLELHGEYANNG